MNQAKTPRRNLLFTYLMFIFGTALIVLNVFSTRYASKDVLGLISGTRYREKVFTEVVVTKNVKHGEAKPYGSQVVKTLNLDIYQPKDDPITKRPAIILVHGGGFVLGSKEYWNANGRFAENRGG